MYSIFGVSCSWLCSQQSLTLTLSVRHRKWQRQWSAIHSFHKYVRGTMLRARCIVRSETDGMSIMEVTVGPRVFSPFSMCGSGVNPMPLRSFALYGPAYRMPSILPCPYRLGSLGWSREDLGRGEETTTLRYKRLKPFAQGHSIGQC